MSRIILGAGEGPSYGVSLNAAAKWLPPDRRGLGYGIMSVGSVVGLLWVVLWWFLGRESPEEVGMAVAREQVSHEKISWSHLWPLLLSRTFIFTTLAGFGYFWWVVLLTSWYALYLVEVRHFTVANLTFILGLPWLVTGIFLILFGGLADALFRRTGSSRRSYVTVLGPLMIVSAVLLYASVSVSSTFGSILLFTLIPVGGVVPISATIIANVTPAARRGTAQGIQVALATLAGIIASVVTGAIIQRAGNDVALGFHNAFLVGSIVILVLGGAFWLFVRPDENVAVQETE